jgi:hypothetical protein
MWNFTIKKKLAYAPIKFLLLANFDQISMWKIWLQPLERIFIEKMIQIHSNVKEFFSKSADFKDKFQQVAKNIK